MHPEHFVAKWHNAGFSEKQGSQEMFLDICAVVGHPTPGEYGDSQAFTFEKWVPSGFADAYLEGRFGWEFKGADEQLRGVQPVAPLPGVPEDAAAAHRVVLRHHTNPHQLSGPGNGPARNPGGGTGPSREPAKAAGRLLRAGAVPSGPVGGGCHQGNRRLCSGKSLRTWNNTTRTRKSWPVT